MRTGFIMVTFWIVVTMLFGCVNQSKIQCKPMLFPYIEYELKAKQIKLGAYFNNKDTNQSAELFNLRMRVPAGWVFEKMFEKTYVFKSESGRKFLFSLETDTPYSNNIEGINLLGCENFIDIQKDLVKTEKEFYTDLFLFTGEQLNKKPISWQYSVLWSKSNILRDAVALFHYKGDHLEAFQRNFDQERTRGDLRNEIVIFPNKIAPDYITIASLFDDDHFFATFVDMLNALNP